jgi:hypothetical protein
MGIELMASAQFELDPGTANNNEIWNIIEKMLVLAEKHGPTPKIKQSRKINDSGTNLIVLDLFGNDKQISVIVDIIDSYNASK